MTKKPLVSILVNAYNEERYIKAALDSAIAQTYENIEIIVLDDHSTDETAEIVKAYVAKDARVHYIKPDKRVGIIEGRNAMLREAKGDYLAYLDADDIYLPDKIKEQAEFLSQHADVSVVYCNIGYFFDGQIPQTIYRHRYHFHSGDGVFEELLEKMFITNTAVMFRRALYDKLGGYRTDLGIVEDWEYFLRITHKGYRIAFLDRDLVRYRLRWDSHTNFKQQVKVQESAVAIFENLKKEMDATDRAKYRIDYWVAKRKEKYAIALLAVGRGRAARETIAQITDYIGLPKKYAMILLSFLPGWLNGFAIEQAWKIKKKNLFVPAGNA